MSELIRNMPASEYHSTRRVSKSGLDKIARRPAHSVAAIQSPSAPSKSMRIGTAVHSLVLEGIAPIVRPDFSGTGSRAAKAEWDSAHAGALILDKDEAADVHAMAASVALHPIAGPAFRRADGFAEASIMWDCEVTGAKCKSRPDWIIPGALIDLKTSGDASPSAFARSVASYRYQVQAAYYLQAAACAGLGAEHFIFVVVESAAPFAVAVYQLDDEAMEHGRKLYLRDLETYMRCKESGAWPGYPTDIQVLSLPRWATYEQES